MKLLALKKKQSYVYLNFYLYDYDGGFETQMHPDFLGGIKSMCYLTLPKVVSEFVDIVGVSVEIDGVSVVFNGICVKICVSVELGDV